MLKMRFLRLDTKYGFKLILPTLIFGVYPSIVVWFEYKVNEKLFTDPVDDIASCMIYVSVTKLYLFLITLFFMDQVFLEYRW